MTGAARLGHYAMPASVHKQRNMPSKNVPRMTDFRTKEDVQFSISSYLLGHTHTHLESIDIFFVLSP